MNKTFKIILNFLYILNPEWETNKRRASKEKMLKVINMVQYILYNNINMLYSQIIKNDKTGEIAFSKEVNYKWILKEIEATVKVVLKKKFGRYWFLLQNVMCSL